MSFASLKASRNNRAKLYVQPSTGSTDAAHDSISDKDDSQNATPPVVRDPAMSDTICAAELSAERSASGTGGVDDAVKNIGLHNLYRDLPSVLEVRNTSKAGRGLFTTIEKDYKPGESPVDFVAVENG
jgi:hypothetical protein